MPIQGQIVIVSFSVFILLFVVELLRRRKISEAMTLWWLLIVILIIFLTVNKTMLLCIASLTGTLVPINALTLFSLLFILIMLVYFSMKIYTLSYNLKELSQYIALLENRLRKLERNGGEK